MKVAIVSLGYVGLPPAKQFERANAKSTGGMVAG